MMKFLRLLPAIFLTLAATGPQDNPAVKPRDTSDKALIAYEQALHTAVAKADQAAFQSLVRADGVWTTGHGFIPLNLLVNGLDGFKLTRWDIVNPHVTWIDDNSAVVLYVWTGAGTFNEQPLPATMLASTVWARRDGKWLAVHHQRTGLIQ